MERAEADYQDALALRDQLREQIATVPQYLEVDAAPQVIFNNGGAANSPIAELERRIKDTERQIVLLLTGGLTMDYGDGSSAMVPPGGVLVGEDTEGRGHITRALDGAPRLSLFAHLDNAACF